MLLVIEAQSGGLLSVKPGQDFVVRVGEEVAYLGVHQHGRSVGHIQQFEPVADHHGHPQRSSQDRDV